MGQTPDDKIARWMQAAGQTGKSDSVRQRIIIAGEFLEKTGRMSEADACDCLSGIDFSRAVSVTKLSSGVYVQYVQKHKGVWFTSTGLTPDAVGLAEGRRTRKLFTRDNRSCIWRDIAPVGEEGKKVSDGTAPRRILCATPLALQPSRAIEKPGSAHSPPDPQRFCCGDSRERTSVFGPSCPSDFAI